MVSEGKSRLLESLQANSFVDYLQPTLGLDEDELPRSGEWSKMGSTIGALALRLQALNLDQVDDILALQEDSHEKRLFGELAVDLGYLTADQVNRLLEIQDIMRQIELAAQLTLTGKLDVPSLVDCLNDYVSQQDAACV